MKALLHKCSELRVLDLTSCKAVRGRAFVEQPSEGMTLFHLHSLESLRLADLPDLHPESLLWYMKLTCAQIPR